MVAARAFVEPQEKSSEIFLFFTCLPLLEVYLSGAELIRVNQCLQPYI
ncbi:hypothetical protein DsansV1_C15g0138651 [Dioscorea sansibarensis]